MTVCLISDTKSVSPLLVNLMIDRSISRILVVDTAGPDQAKRGGSAAALYRGEGHDVTVRDILTEGLPDLADFEAIHFSGGNPYRLMMGALKHDLQTKLEDRMLSGDFLVVGCSAGAMIIGRSIDHAKILCPDLGLGSDCGFGWMDSRIMPHLDLAGRYGDRIREHVAANPGENWLQLHEEDFEIFNIEDLQISQAPSPSI